MLLRRVSEISNLPIRTWKQSISGNELAHRLFQAASIASRLRTKEGKNRCLCSARHLFLVGVSQRYSLTTTTQTTDAAARETIRFFQYGELAFLVEEGVIFADVPSDRRHMRICLVGHGRPQRRCCGSGLFSRPDVHKSNSISSRKLQLRRPQKQRTCHQLRPTQAPSNRVAK